MRTGGMGRASGGRPRRVRRRLEWADTVVLHNAFGPNLPQSDDLLAGFVTAGGSREGLTIMRTRITWSYAPAAVGDQLRVGLIVTETAAAALQLNPLSEPYEDWMLNHAVYPNASGATVDATRIGEIDNRAKRKITGMRETYWMSVVASTATTNSWTAHVRTLVALP